jgi:DNA polymerase-1
MAADATPPSLHSAPPAGRLVLVDVYALIFQNFHAIRSPMSSPDGRPTGAVFGVTRDLLALRALAPDYLLVAYDVGEPTIRTKVFADYKAHRPEPPDDLRLQIPIIKQVIEAMNLPGLGVPGYEADDVIATVATAAAGRGLDVVICTSDKDCRQLLGERVRMLNFRKDHYLDPAALRDDWGIGPEQVVDYQALVGDSADNVPGVPGVGAKTAAKLLQQFGGIDGMLARLDEVKPPRIRDAIKASADAGTLALSRQLVRLDTAVPLPLDWDAWRMREWDAPRLLELFNELGFRRFAADVRASLKDAKEPARVALPAGGGASDLFADVAGDVDDSFPFGANAPADDWQADYRLVDTPKGFDAFLKQLRAQKRFVFDLETTSLDPFAGAIVGLAFCWRAGEASYLPLKAPEGTRTLDTAATLAALKPVFENPAVEKVNQNIKFDALVLAVQGGITLAGVAGDPMLAHYLLHAGERSHGLDELAREYLKHENISITTLIGKKGKAQLTMDQVPVEKVRDYAAEDADVAWRLAERLEPEVTGTGRLGELYRDLEVPLVPLLVELEATGVRINADYLRTLGDEMAVQLQAMEKEIHALAGHEFNVNSPKQLRVVLFDELKLPPQKRTGITNEPSTDQETLEALGALGFELPRKIVEYRQVAKLKGTYVDALPALIRPATGRVHTSFNQAVAATGRLSSSEPNLQNIPARSDQGKQIRTAFVPAEGWVLVTADYSQVELRLLAHFCGDDELRRAFAEDRDVHTLVAAEIFKVPPAEVTSAQRRMAKTVNFGVIYGISAHGLSVRLGLPRDEAARFIDAYFARYPKVLGYHADLLARCARDGYVETLLGRRRAFDRAAIRPRSPYQSRNATEREAINMEIQGTAADLMKRAMLAVRRRMTGERLSARMLLTVHDELVFEAPRDEVDTLARLAREEMAGALGLTVPLKVDVAAGPNWLDVAEVPA